MRRFACWVMLVSLMMIQAHAVLPHHHHDNATGHHLGFGAIADHGCALDGQLCEIAPHDEPYLGGTTRSQRLQFQLEMALPISLEFDLPERIWEGKRQCILVEHSYATAPFGTKTSRAPPVSLTA